MVVTNGNPIYPLQSFLWMCGHVSDCCNDTNSEPLGFAQTFIVFIILIIVFEILLRRTRFGRNIYATGSNLEVAKLPDQYRRVRYTTLSSRRFFRLWPACWTLRLHGKDIRLSEKLGNAGHRDDSDRRYQPDGGLRFPDRYADRRS
jgi:hypothetical protein